MQQQQQVQQVHQQQEEAEDKYFKFRRTFNSVLKALLAATQANSRGSIREIKCRRCPKTTFKTWEDFKRRCNTTETHPLNISSNDCGDFFARCDSLKRHRRHPPTECLSVTHEKANEKRRETQSAHSDFIARLERFLR